MFLPFGVLLGHDMSPQSSCFHPWGSSEWKEHQHFRNSVASYRTSTSVVDCLSNYALPGCGPLAIGCSPAMQRRMMQAHMDHLQGKNVFDGVAGMISSLRWMTASWKTSWELQAVPQTRCNPSLLGCGILDRPCSRAFLCMVSLC